MPGLAATGFRRVAQLASSWVRSTRNLRKNVVQEPGVAIRMNLNSKFLGPAAPGLKQAGPPCDYHRGATIAPPGRHIILAGLCLASLAGCGGSSKGPERAAISGTVTLDETPIQQGTIIFLPSGAKGGPTSGGVIENGKYSIPAEKGAVLGEHKIEIRSMTKTGKQIPVLPPAASATGFVDEMVEAVPAKFNSNTTLTVTVESGFNVVDFDLKSE